MSVEHHGSPGEQAATRRMLDEFLGNAKPRFPDGKSSPDDEGMLAFAISHDIEKKIVVLRFSKPVDWLGMSRSDTLALVNKLIEHAAKLPK